MKTYTIDQVQDNLIGKKGTLNREIFELELQMDLIGNAIKESRKERKMTQAELGNLIGVQKAQISRIENNVKNVTLETLIRVFSALKAKIKLQIELPELNGN
jgi:DNA-binding XRE family transcriptional regulator